MSLKKPSKNSKQERNMGDQPYAYRGHYSVYDDGWKDKNHSAASADKVGRTVIHDRDGRQQTAFGYEPYDTTTYVVQSEQVTNRRRPQEVNEFLNGIQVEASRAGKVQIHSGGGYGDYRKGNAYGGYSSDEYSDEEGNDDYYYERSDHEVRQYPRSIAPAVTHGMGRLSLPVSSIDEAVDYLKGSNNAAVSAKPHGASNFRSTATTTTGTVKPAYGEGIARPYGTKYHDYSASVKPYSDGATTNNSYGTVNKSNFETTKYHQSSSDPVKPYGSANLSSTYENTKYHQVPEPMKPYGASTTATNHRFGGANLINSTSETKYQASEAVKPYGTTPANHRFGGANLINSTSETKYHQTPEAHAKPHGTSTINGYGTVNKMTPNNYATEVSRTSYGTTYFKEPDVKLSGSPVGYGTTTSAGATTGTSTVIDCYEAAKRYNGKVIRT